MEKPIGIIKLAKYIRGIMTDVKDGKLFLIVDFKNGKMYLRKAEFYG